MSQSASVRELAARIVRLERDVRNVSVSPQLGRSSLDDEAVNVYDADGGLKATVGRQHDGTYTTGAIDGPVPPVPAGLSTLGGQGEGTVVWDGTYADDARAPMDFHVVEVWVAAADFTDRADARLLGHFSNESGGELTAALPVGEWFVGLVCKSEAGRRSAVSGRVTVEVESVVDQAALDALESALEGLDVDLEDLTGTVLPGLRSDITTITDVTLPALDTALGDARGDITDAFGQIDTVDGKADQAVSDAADAQTAAGTAQDAANDAAQAAIDRANDAEAAAAIHAEAKADAAELAAIAAASGDATDKADAAQSAAELAAALDATQKADAARQAAEVKAQTAQDAADDAQGRADAAHTLAGTAEGNAQTAITRANAAQTSADNVAKSLFSPAAPSGTAPYGSIWFRVNSTGEVVGQWQQTATGIASTWTERPVRSEVIANLDVGKLTAGTANIATVTAQKIAGAVGTFLELNADQINAGKIDTERLNAAAVGAAVGAFIDLSADQITAIGAGFDTAVINSLFADMFTANKITAAQLTAGTITADEIATGAITAGKLAAGAIDAMVLNIMSSDHEPGVPAVRISGDGVALFDTQGGEAVSLTAAGEQYVTLRGPGGETVTSLDAEGGAAFETLAVVGEARLDGTLTVGGDALPDTDHGSGLYGPVINGRDLLGKSFVEYTEEHAGVRDYNAWMTALPFGLVGRGSRNIQGTSTNRNEAEVLEVSFDGMYSRSYLVSIAPLSMYVSAGAHGRINIRRSVDSRPTLSTPLWQRINVRTHGGSSGSDLMHALSGSFHDSGSTGRIRYLFSIEGAGGSATVFNASVGGTLSVMVEDVGLTPADSGVNRDGATTPPPVVNPVRSYTKTYNVSWHESYRSNGQVNSFMSGKMAQGYSNYASSQGNQRSLAGFPSAAGILSGATVTKIEVYIYAQHWHSSTGGTLSIGVHGHTSTPSTWSSSSNHVKSQKMKKPEGRWITLPSSVHGGFKSGSYRGISLLAPSNSSAYYGYAKGSSTKLRITYKK